MRQSVSSYKEKGEKRNALFPPHIDMDIFRGAKSFENQITWWRIIFSLLAQSRWSLNAVE